MYLIYFYNLHYLIIKILIYKTNLYEFNLKFLVFIFFITYKVLSNY